MNASTMPRIPDLQTGLGYLSRLPLANPSQALPAIRQFYETLIRDPLPPKVFLQLLEQARLPLATVLETMSLRFHNMALPLGDIEEDAFAETVAGWQLAASAYARCAQNDAGRDPEHANRIALILHRCVHYLGLAIHEHYLARRELPPGIWLDLYGYYASAEEWGIATHPVTDPLDPNQTTTHCAAALITVLLTDLAGPYSFSVRDINLIRRWAALWSPLVSVHHASMGDSLPEYVVDLMQDVGVKYSQDLTPNNDQRRLDTSRLGIQIIQVQVQLKRHVSPSQLGLGQDVANAHCQQLLETLSRPWTQAASPRRFRRRPATGTARLAIGFEPIHYFVSGQAFSQPDSVRQYSRKDFDTLFTFRHMVDPTQQLEISKREIDYPTDEWQVLNQSANGFRLERSVAGQRLAHRQLVGLRPPDGERMILAKVHWLMQEHEGGLVAGIGVLTGAPVAVAARPVGLNVSPQEPYARAFMMPAIAAIRVGATLVLPQGWFQPDRVVEVFSESPWRAKLTALVEKGEDFDQVSYVLAA